MRMPLIGLTTYTQTNKYGFPIAAVMQKYVSAVVEAGGTPILIPSGLSNGGVEELTRTLDGFLFTGGGDLAPSLYGENLHPNLIDVDDKRDAIEFNLIKYIIERRKPFLGICRGLQTINVALGGSLYSHIPDQLPSAIKHNFDSGSEREYLAHPVEIAAGTLLVDVFREKMLSVNSLHHQAVKTLGTNLVCTGVAPDGVVEAIELSNYPFGVAVQWHPEWLGAQPTSRKLFHALIVAAEMPPG